MTTDITKVKQLSTGVINRSLMNANSLVTIIQAMYTPKIGRSLPIYAVPYIHLKPILLLY